jgi:alkylation response protein AidB-like acyl-CoA dehydrogenase
VRFAFSRDQLLFRDALRDMLKRECPPAVVRAAWDTRGVGEALWRTLAELGVVGLTVPEEHGGLGLGALDWVLLFEECGRFAAPVPLVETMAAAVPLVAAIGSDEFKRGWLPLIARGEARVAIAFASAPFVRDADAADALLIEHGGTILTVPPGDITLEDAPSVDRSRRLFRVTQFETTHAEPWEDAQPAIDAAFDRAALATSAELLGLGARMIEMTVDYAKVRKQFGSAIGSFQAVKHHLATAHMKLELARPAVYRAAHSIDQADPETPTHVAMAKACASDAATFAARVALQCHGAIGYSFEHDLHLWMKRAWALASAWGDAAWQRERVAKAIIDHRPSAISERTER